MATATATTNRKEDRKVWATTDIGVVEGWYALYFAIVGKYEEENGETFFRLPDSGDVALAALINGFPLTNKNSTRIKAEKEVHGQSLCRPCGKPELAQKLNKEKKERTAVQHNLWD